MRFRTEVNGEQVTLRVDVDTGLPVEIQYARAVRIASMLGGVLEIIPERLPGSGKQRVVLSEIADKADMFRSDRVRVVLDMLVQAYTTPEGGRAFIEFDDKCYLEEKAGRKVYVACNGQSGDERVFDTMAKAKAWLLDSISKSAGNDGDQWDGWTWWMGKDNYEYFGVKDVWEGNVKEFTVE